MRARTRGVGVTPKVSFDQLDISCCLHGDERADAVCAFMCRSSLWYCQRVWWESLARASIASGSSFSHSLFLFLFFLHMVINRNYSPHYYLFMYLFIISSKLVV